MAMGSASVSNCLTKSVKYELLFISRVYGWPSDHFRRYRVCFLIFFPSLCKKKKKPNFYKRDLKNMREVTIATTGWKRQFVDDVKIVTNLFFYKCKVVHIRQGQSF